MAQLTPEQLRQAFPSYDQNGNPVQKAAPGVPDPRVAQLEAAAKKQAAENAARPKMPGFENIRGPNGQLKSQYQLKDVGAVESPWLKQQLAQQDLQKTAALNRGAQQAATGAASAQAQLARRGGLSSGSAERLAGAAQEQQALGAQNIYSQADQAANDTQVNDMKTQRDYLTGLNQQNLQNTLLDIGSKRQFDLGKYGEQMKGWGAEQAAKATEQGGGGGSVICTALKDVGLISHEQHKKSAEFRSEVTTETYKAYLRWGRPVANAIRFLPALGYCFRPLVRYFGGDRDLLAVAQYRLFNAFNKLVIKQGVVHAV
jgi:hypothetical protein